MWDAMSKFYRNMSFCVSLASCHCRPHSRAVGRVAPRSTCGHSTSLHLPLLLAGVAFEVDLDLGEEEPLQDGEMPGFEPPASYIAGE